MTVGGAVAHIYVGYLVFLSTIAELAVNPKNMCHSRHGNMKNVVGGAKDHVYKA